MAASSVVCSWLMAACMSVAYEKESSISMLSTTSSNSSRLSKWAAHRRKRVLAKCAQHFVNSSFALEPCHHFHKSSHASECFFGFGSRNVPVQRSRRKLLRPSAHSGASFCLLLLCASVSTSVIVLIFLCSIVDMVLCFVS